MRNFDLTPLYRSAIGFDRLFNLLESNQNQSNGGYPPYNVELVDENHYRITIAVAGFSQSELDITAHDNVLIVRGAILKSRLSVNTCIRGLPSVTSSVNSSSPTTLWCAMPALKMVC